MHTGAAARPAEPVIDVHAHVVLEATMGTAGGFGPELGVDADGTPWFRIGEYYLRGVQYKGSPFMDASVRLARMERDGISFQVLSPNPLTYFHYIPAQEAVRFCRAHNDALAKLVADHPHRLAGLAALPVQCPESAAEELQRAVRELGLLRGGIGTEWGTPLDSPELDVVWATATSLDVPIFMHPAPRGIDGPVGDPRLRRFELDVVVGFNLESTLAICTLIFGGVLARHPNLDLCFPSGGGAIPFVSGRLAAAAAAPRPWVSDELRSRGALERALRRLWFDTHVHGAHHPCPASLHITS